MTSPDLEPVGAWAGGELARLHVRDSHVSRRRLRALGARSPSPSLTLALALNNQGKAAHLGGGTKQKYRGKQLYCMIQKKV